MNNIIKVEKKAVYGVERVYVISEQKEALQALTGEKTLSSKSIEALKVLGYSFEVKTKTI